MEISDENDLTRNKIRYLDKNTIEVKLTQDKIMKTDSKFIKEVEKYPINVKSKKTKNGSSRRLIVAHGELWPGLSAVVILQPSDVFTQKLSI